MRWDQLPLGSPEREHVFHWLERLTVTFTDIDNPIATGDKLTARAFYELLKACMLEDADLPAWATDPYVDPNRLPANRATPLRLER